MKNTINVYIVGNNIEYISFIQNAILVDDLSKAQIVLFTGGEDVHPSLYKCARHPTTDANLQRDLAEQAIFQKVRTDQLCIGICRGSQFLCVMNGGKLVQNVANHALFFSHNIIEHDTNKVYATTSTHHQMQYPFNCPPDSYTILMSSYPSRSPIYEGSNIKIGLILTEPEIVLYHNPKLPKCLAIQGHPEYMDPNSALVLWINEFIENHFK